MILHTYTPYHTYTLWFPRYSQEKNLKVNFTTERLKVKSSSHNDIAYLYPSQCPNQVSTFYSLQFLRNGPDKILKVKVTTAEVKGLIKVTPPCCRPTIPNQCPYQASTFYTLGFLGYRKDKIVKFKVTTARSKVKSRSYHDAAWLHPQPMSLRHINHLHITVSEI